MINVFCQNGKPTAVDSYDLCSVNNPRISQKQTVTLNTKCFCSYAGCMLVLYVNMTSH